METEPHRSQINTHPHTHIQAYSKRETHTHTNALVHTQGHVNRPTLHIHQNPSMRGREINKKTDRVDEQPYLFVHFNVEAIRHLIVLGEGREAMSERVRGGETNPKPLKEKA